MIKNAFMQAKVEIETRKPYVLSSKASCNEESTPAYLFANFKKFKHKFNIVFNI